MIASIIVYEMECADNSNHFVSCYGIRGVRIGAVSVNFIKEKNSLLKS